MEEINYGLSIIIYQYNHEFKPSEDLISFLKEKLKNSKYPVRAGNHIEDRGSMLNFSILEEIVL